MSRIANSAVSTVTEEKLTDGVVCYIREAAASLGYPALKPEQEEAITQFLMGMDVFVALPTGYGKSLCYCCLPSVFDRVRSVEEQSIVVFVSPLTALMKDQVAVCHSKGLTEGCVIAACMTLVTRVCSFEMTPSAFSNSSCCTFKSLS